MIKELLTKGDAEVKLEKLGFSDGKRALKELKLLDRSPLAQHIELTAKHALSSPSPGGALNNLERIIAVVSEKTLSRFLESKENLKNLITICGSSQMLSNTLVQDPALFSELFLENSLNRQKDLSVFSKELDEFTEGVDSFERMAKLLRLYRKREYLRIGARDLLGLASLEETTRELSDLASACLDRAVEFSISSVKEDYGTPYYTDEEGKRREAGFSVIGLGKLGGRELNFSSDIDILYIYSSDKGESSGIEGRPDSRITLHAFFINVSKMVTRLISSVTEDGFVFRADLDLRPEGRSGTLANSLRSMEIYYESWGQTWERSAMIKARPVAGSMDLGARFLEMVTPFVYRKYMDFTAIEEIKSMKERINLSLLRRNPDTVDVKLGAGGIREIEFFVQALQLIHGGRDQNLREKNTLKTIERLCGGGHLKTEQADTLKQSYIFLRNLEHRIQIVEGRQTQAVPAREEELERLARMMGFKDTEQRRAGGFFWEEYRARTSRVHSLFRSLFYKSEEEGLEEKVPKEIRILLSADLGEDEAEQKLTGLGFRYTSSAFENLRILRDGPPGVRLSARARVLLQRIGPYMLSLSASSPDPDGSLGRLVRFISAIGARTSLYSLLCENPPVIEEIIRLFGSSVFLSNTLIEHPERLDILLSREMANPEKTKEEIFKELEEVLAQAVDYEEKLDAIRRFRNQEVFRIGLNDVTEKLTPPQVSVQITGLAEASLELSLRLAHEELSRRYGGPGEVKFSIIGLGKLGGRELIYGSDLDIMFLYSDTGENAETSGPKKISFHEFFVKLAQRIISILTVTTKEGHVFKVDARLRPSGSSGPLVVSRSSLLRYHREKTEVWERQALIRARVVAGDFRFGTEVLKELEEILYSKPLTPDDIEELLRIRKRMEAEIARETSTRYNIKTGKGGLVDIEFLTQTLQLKYGKKEPALITPYTLEALSRIRDKGFLAQGSFEVLYEAYTFYRLLEMRLRVVHDRPEGDIIKDTEELKTLARRMGYTGPDAGERLLKDYMARSEKVREIYLETLKGL